MKTEWKIGEIFEYNGEWYQCVKGNDCENCAFKERKCYLEEDTGDPIGECCYDRRRDNKDVIFKKLEKAGEPFERNGYMYQEYKTHTYPLLMSGDAKIPTDNGFAVIIKQTKEDMEEKDLVEKLSEKVHNAWMKEKEAQGFSYGKEYDKEKKKHPDMLPYNELKEEVKEYDRVTVKAVLQAQKELSADANKLSLKEFNLEAAKSGKPVCTRDGKKARIICFDKGGEQPIVALIEKNEEESIDTFFSNGHSVSKTNEVAGDLMMLPEKKEGWAKIRKDINLYDTKEEADRKMIGNDDYVTAKVFWEE